MVLGFLWELDTSAPDDSFLSSLNVSSATGGTADVSNVPMAELFSWSNNYNKYNYKGGLTTPGCVERVEWMVVSEPRKINQAQLSQFTAFWAGNSSFANGKGNNRLVQPLNRRSVNLVGGKYDDGDDDHDWVWPVVSVLIVLLVIATALAVIMLICYLTKAKEVGNRDLSKYEAQEVSQKDDDGQAEQANM